jgi:8-oxo-dGTP pyrophosphatase MutT (NUDIX family)
VSGRPVRQGVVAVVVREGRFLVIRRSEKVVAPGAFCFPGGGIEAGETEEVALVRELREELDVWIRPRRLLWRSVTPWNVALAWWLSEFDGEPTCNPAEVASFHWHTAEELAGLPQLLESNHHFLAAIARGEIVLA